jgi:hypothetical protein
VTEEPLQLSNRIRIRELKLGEWYTNSKGQKSHPIVDWLIEHVGADARVQGQFLSGDGWRFDSYLRQETYEWENTVLFTKEIPEDVLLMFKLKFC